ncbi:MAG: chloride channel protein [Actinomycetota bacterium]|nr:chloride channel protein [Actinomycetota bacterium]
MNGGTAEHQPDQPDGEATSGSSPPPAPPHDLPAAAPPSVRSGHIMQPNVPLVWGSSRELARFWLLVAVTGIGAGIGAALLMEILHGVQHLAYGYHGGLFQRGVQAAPPLRRVIVMAIAGVTAGLAWLTLRRFTHLSTGLSESVWEEDGKLPFVFTIVNSVVQIVTVALGATLGREGAPKETGAAIASKVSDVGGLTAAQRRLLVACGAGAGMAAVYNVPLGGALFGLEVLLGTLTLPMVLPALATAGIATGVSWVLLPDQPTYRLPTYAVTPSLAIAAIVCGPLAGVLAVGYIRLFAWSKEHRPGGWRLLVSLAAVFVAVGCVSVEYPEVLGNGKDLAQFLFLGQLGLSLVAVLLVIRPLATGTFLRGGAVGGLFTPTLAFGALFGAVFGHAWTALWPGTEPGAYAIIGASAMLAAAMQAPLASLALMVELTGTGGSLLVPLILAVIGAMLVSRALDDRSIYTAPLRHFGEPTVVRHPRDRGTPGPRDRDVTPG